ncbi:MAG TPA: tRNA (adenosine(37)-N6)-threonylcarbamoyltransferase complex dimerization subunit type 1 TsaB [Solirubrobacteraceae bacterium]
MIVLGIDTSTSATAAALSMPDGALFERRDDPPAGSHPGHATRLLTMVDGLLADAAIGLADVGRIAVGAGPGTFTGLRVGIATARGLAHSLGSELAAVSSLEALAFGALSAGGAAGRAVLATIDARRGEVFAAAYSPDQQELAAGRALAPQELGSLLAEAELEAALPLGVGDGAVRYRAALEAAGAEVPPDDSPLHLLRGAAICELGRVAAAVGYAEVLPDYLRRPDAELALEGATGGADS